MTATEPLNLSSLKLVQDELVATIEQAATRLEQFSKDRHNGELLQSCIDGIRQIRGTLSLLQMRGVDLLAQELEEHITDFTLGDEHPIDHQLDLLTTAFFILPRYLEYCLQSSRSMAVLLIPHINQLRLARRAPLLPDSYFYPLGRTDLPPRTNQSSALLSEDLGALIRRLRHMYQVGLLKVLNGRQVGPSLGMMTRALERIATVTRGRPQGNLWWVAGATLESFRANAMQLTLSRKRLLSQLDREIRTLQRDSAALERVPDPVLLKELLYLIALAEKPSGTAQAVIEAYQLAPLNYTETELARELELLTGPSANTLSSMSAVLQDELRTIKNILERAAQGGGEMLTETPELLENLKKVADILAVVGLVTPGNSLRNEIKRINTWIQAGQAPSPAELQEVADTLLYVESTVAGLGRINLSDEKLAQINAISREEAISSNQLAEAERLVLDEAETGLTLVKRGLSSFVESQYDKGHIRNVSATLASVRGGMTLMALPRAAAVVASCIRFIDEALLKNEQPAAVRHMLETFADAIISLEHYLDSLKDDRGVDDGVLQIAEESLEALGYPVA